jgi:putative hydrolase of the HAD superfamily
VDAKIRAVAFDYGKVICLPPEEGVMAELAAVAGMEAGALEELIWSFRGEYDRGTLSARDYYRTLLARGGAAVDEPGLEKMIRLDMDSWKNLDPGTVKLMEDVKALGLKLGILSNMPRDFLRFARQNLPVFALPDAGIFSCELGAVKPEAAMYQALIAALGCAAGEIVFFDDVPVNVEQAAARGIRAFLWKDSAAARDTLRQFGVAL